MRASHRKAILFTILGGVVAFILWDPAHQQNLSPPSSRASPQRHSQNEGAAAAPGAKGEAKTLALALPERPALGEPRSELFGPQSWQPPAPKITAAAAAPSAPPMPYRFAGRLVQNGQLQVFLSKGDTPIPIKQGEVLDGTYRVESIGEDRITLVYLPLGHKEIIPVSAVFSAAGTGAPAVGAVPPDGKAPAAGIGTIPTGSILASPSMPSSSRMSQSR